MAERNAFLALSIAFATALVMPLAQAAFAGDSVCGEQQKCACRGGLMLCCPDDYCPKPLPCVPWARCCCPDDYCCKPYPYLFSPALSCCGDDYCCKPFPHLCWPRLPVHYSCGPPARDECAAPKQVTDYFDGSGKK